MRLPLLHQVCNDESKAQLSRRVLGDSAVQRGAGRTVRTGKLRLAAKSVRDAEFTEPNPVSDGGSEYPIRWVAFPGTNMSYVLYGNGPVPGESARARGP